jgi:hypothetical protein
MFRGTLDGQPLRDVTDALEAIGDNDKPTPQEVSSANRLMVPAGPMPARGWVLMMAKDLLQLDLDDLHDLHFEYDAENGSPLQTMDFYNLPITREPICLTPSNMLANDPNSLYLIELSDSRFLVDNPYFCQSINAQYNVRAPAYVGAEQYTKGAAQTPLPIECYYVQTLDNSNPDDPVTWTWKTMLNDIWDTMKDQLGPFPSFSVNSKYGIPENWSFIGVSAWKSLNQVLTKLGYMVRPDLTQEASQYKFVQVGASDTDLDDTLSQAVTNNRLIHDGLFQSSRRAQWPQNVTVFFHRLEQAGGERTTTNDDTQWSAGQDPSGRPAYSIDIAGPDLTNTEPNIFHPIWDDLPAIFDADNNLLNESDLQTRAKLRAADYYRLQTDPGGTRKWQRFRGLLDIAPGSTLKGVTWIGGAQDGPDKGIFTEIVRHPFLYLKAGNTGAWEECFDESVKLHAPNLRPTWPNYPEKTQVLRVGNGPNPEGLLDCMVQVPSGDFQTSPPTTLLASLVTGGFLQADQAVYYVVTTLTGENESISSNEVKITPTGVTLSVKLTWRAVGDADSYKIYSGLSPGGEDTLVATITNGSTTTYTDNGTQGEAGTPPNTSVAWADAEPVWGLSLGDAVYGFGAMCTGRLISFKASSIPPPNQMVPAVSSGGGLSVGTVYYYSVTALFADDTETLLSNETAIEPASLNQTANLAWTEVPNATEYNVYRTTTEGVYDDYSLLTTTTKLLFVDTGEATNKGQPSRTLATSSRPLYVFLGGGTGGPLQRALADVVCSNVGALQKTYVYVR